jgi:nanoRNase/pAp phosphatase (c-di-AMP/oligoRNAs hydrolase)
MVIASHDNPDPDAIASSLLLQKLLKRRFNISTTVTYSGVIGRAENARLLEYSGARFMRLDDVDINRFDGVALVDTQPGTGNHRFNRDVTLVFDHHRRRAMSGAVEFQDIRAHLGATTTLMYLYWKAARIRLTRRFATLMLYALGSETADMGREASALDREIYKELYASSDLRALSSIINAKVGRAYFRAMHRGLGQSKMYGPVVVTRIGKLPYPDVVAQIADYFLRLEDASYTFAIGTFGGSLLLSLRADDPEAHLGAVARSIVGDKGTAGGHGAAAGGQINVRGMTEKSVVSVQEAVIRRLLSQLGQRGKRGRSLV